MWVSPPDRARRNPSSSARLNPTLQLLRPKSALVPPTIPTRASSILRTLRPSAFFPHWRAFRSRSPAQTFFPPPSHTPPSSLRKRPPPITPSGQSRATGPEGAAPREGPAAPDSPVVCAFRPRRIMQPGDRPPCEAAEPVAAKRNAIEGGG